MQPETPTSGARNEPQATAAPRADVARPVVLAASGLRKAFGGQIVLDGVDLELREGEVILLRGDNGSGKTTLINILTGNLEPDAGTIHYLADGSPREFRFPRRWWQELNPFDHFTPESTAREGIGRTWQDVRLFPSQTLRDNIAVADPHHPGENPIRALFAPGRGHRHEAEITRQADAMLARLGLAGRETSSGDKISLGQSKRVAVARAVAAGARILFLDEPLAGLDRQGIEDVLTLLESVARDHAVTLAIVEHVFNHQHLHGLVTADWLLEKGKASFGDSRATGRMVLSEVADRPWLKLLADDANTVNDEPLPHGAVLTRISRSEHANTFRKPVLEIRDLVVNRGPRTVIGLKNERNETGLNLKLYAGEIAVLQAPNGWGKSTLLAAIGGLVTIAGGEILLDSRSLARSPVWDRVRSGVQLVPSDHNLFPNLSARNVLQLAGCADSAIAFGQLSGRSTSELSGGEKQRLALLAGRGCSKARLRMFDEPFANLDAPAMREAAGNILVQVNDAVLVALPSTDN